jgi:uracil-DNA glycosylase
VLASGGDGIRAVLCLGALAYATACEQFAVTPRPRFGHGVEVPVPGGPTLVCSFHPSQQNTFTGRLTEAMLDAVCARTAVLAADAVSLSDL